MSTLLEVEDLVVHYPVPRGIIGTITRAKPETVHAVDGVSFELAAGEMVALVGESGCGKTSTAQAVMRLVDAEGGAIRFEGRDLTGLGVRALRPLRRRIQMVYQDPYESLDPRFRVRQAVEEPLAIHRLGGSKEEREARVREALARVELTPPELYLDRYPHELSGGQRQRVAIAAALVLEPALLVADEPVSMLDVSVRAGVLALLDSLKRSGLAILMITHDLSTAARFADRIAVMYLGRIVEEGPAVRGRPFAAAPVHARAPLGRPAPRSARPPDGPGPPRRDPRRGPHPERMPLPSALPARLRRVPPRGARAGADTGRAPRGLSPALAPRAFRTDTAWHPA